MNHEIKLAVRYARRAVELGSCISLRYEKERYTPYSTLKGEWYCPADMQFSEILSVMLNIDGETVHCGMPDGLEVERRDNRNVLKVSSKGYSSALLTNQCADKLLTDVDLSAIAASGPTLPYVSYEPNTPKVNYVNYYDGTSCWDAIVCYAIRATGVYPYVRGSGEVCISRAPAVGSCSTDTGRLISRGYASDYSDLVSEISEDDIEGTPSAYVMSDGRITARGIVRCRRIKFDRDWIMDPEKGLEFKLCSSMRGMSCDTFGFLGYSGLDLLDRFSVADIGFSGEVDRLTVTASAEKGIVTEVRCYHDGFCI